MNELLYFAAISVLVDWVVKRWLVVGIVNLCGLYGHFAKRIKMDQPRGSNAGMRLHNASSFNLGGRGILIQVAGA